MYPHYSYPPGFIARLVRDAILLRPRSFRRDAHAAAGRLCPPLQILQPENIPTAGPCLIAVNHYHRPGFAAQWLALAISAVLPMDVHWLMTGELTFPGHWIAPLGRPASRLALNRIGRIYGFTRMPPMPPRSPDLGARAAAVRAVLDFVKHAESPVVGLAPEGGDHAGGRLTRPPSGVGRFCLLLAAHGLRLVPVGVYEADGTLRLRFGPSDGLKVPGGLPAHERDRAAARVVMEAIARLLPPPLRGEFA
jgi:1-acyl-sn-glycerol-3-phosphate acyltransferase